MPDAGLTIKILNLPEVLEAVRRQPEVIAAAGERGITAGAVMVQNEARKNAPKFEDRLTKSINFKVTTDARKISAKVGPSVKYGYWVEMGTRPHLAPLGLTTYGRRWLKAHGFVTESGDTPDYIPVSGKAQPYLLPALESKKYDVLQRVADEISRAAAK